MNNNLTKSFLIDENEYFYLSEFHFNDLFKVSKNKSPINDYFTFKITRKKLKTEIDKGIGVYFFLDYIKDYWKPVYVGLRSDGKAVSHTLLGYSNKEGFHQARVHKHMCTDTFRFNNSMSISPGECSGINDENLYKKLEDILKEFTKKIEKAEGVKIEEIKDIHNPSKWLWRKEDRKEEWNQDIYKLFGHGQKYRYQTCGVVTSYPRFGYAMRNWDIFGDDNQIENLENIFRFYFIQFKKEYFDNFCIFNENAQIKLAEIINGQRSNKSLRKEVKNLVEQYFEIPIICKFSPLVNGGPRLMSASNYGVKWSVKERDDSWKKKNIQSSRNLAKEIFSSIKEPTHKKINIEI